MKPLVDRAQFEQYLKEGYSRIPVAVELLADLETPLSVYLKLADQPWSFLFESVQGGEQWGRYSIIGLPSTRRYVVTGQQCEIFEGDDCLSSMKEADPLSWVESISREYRVPNISNLPAFNGGLVGYFGYDTVRYVEKKLEASCPEDPEGLPDILLMDAQDLVVFDTLRDRMILLTHVTPDAADTWESAQARLLDIQQQLAEPLAMSFEQPDKAEAGEIEHHYEEARFKQDVDRIKDYILAGDCMQVVLSQRMTRAFEVPPINLYRSLRSLNPSPYLFFLNLGDLHIVGSSPEILVRSENQVVTVRPIAGTRPRGSTPEEDQALAEDLLADPKECAEHLMLIDLGRNDVGRVAQIGSVELTENMIIERYSHVMHIVSSVEGQLAGDMSAIDVLKATLPAGTLSGAPKVRAMEIIDELEPLKRGVYGGAVGYISYQGNIDTAIAIRTAVIHKQKLIVQAGAGIVADSIPENEWQETLNKAKAVLRAAELAEELPL